MLYHPLSLLDPLKLLKMTFLINQARDSFTSGFSLSFPVTGFESLSSKWNEDQYEEVQFQIIWMHSISFGIALTTMILLGILYNKDKSSAPNIAEARRQSIG